VTIWENHTQAARSSLTDVMNGTQATMQALQARGFGVEQSRQMVSQLVDGQATAISTLQLFSLAGAIFVAAAAIIWLAPKPRHAVEPGAAH
jgi:DHA2 family multidrug resistance protein